MVSPMVSPMCSPMGSPSSRNVPPDPWAQGNQQQGQYMTNDGQYYHSGNQNVPTNSGWQNESTNWNQPTQTHPRRQSQGMGMIQLTNSQGILFLFILFSVKGKERKK